MTPVEKLLQAIFDGEFDKSNDIEVERPKRKPFENTPFEDILKKIKIDCQDKKVTTIFADNIVVTSKSPTEKFDVEREFAISFVKGFFDDENGYQAFVNYLKACVKEADGEKPEPDVSTVKVNKPSSDTTGIKPKQENQTTRTRKTLSDCL